MLVSVDHQKGQNKGRMVFSSINKIKRNQVDGEGLLYLLFKVKPGRGGGERMKRREKDCAYVWWGIRGNLLISSR